MVILSARATVRAALDTQPRFPYNPNAPRKVKKTPNNNSFLPPPSPPPSPGISISVADLLKRPASKGRRFNSGLIQFRCFVIKSLFDKPDSNEL